MANKIYSWAVVGAGPAGIAAVGQLIDLGVKGEDIAWIDPQFDVGLLGRKWRSVSSNTRVSLFIKFLEVVASFHYKDCPNDYHIHTLDPADTCQLAYIVEPLEWVTEELMKQVQPFKSTVARIEKSSQGWLLKTSSEKITAKKAILATGSHARTMNHDSVPTLPLEDALQIDELYKQVGPDDTVAVFGSSHSAIMIVRDLLARPVKKVMNFYRVPLVYAEYLPNGKIRFDSTGLKGRTAIWAKENIDGNHQPSNLERYLSTPDNIEKYLPECDQAIYAIGFDRAPITVEDVDVAKYNNKTGEIAQGLFGVGIAFPELGPDAVGNMEHQVGLWKFMDYLIRVMPGWGVLSGM